MLRTIPASVPGIHFLSGGMSEVSLLHTLLAATVVDRRIHSQYKAVALQPAPFVCITVQATPMLNTLQAIARTCSYNQRGFLNRACCAGGEHAEPAGPQ